MRGDVIIELGKGRPIPVHALLSVEIDGVRPDMRCPCSEGEVRVEPWEGLPKVINYLPMVLIHPHYAVNPPVGRRGDVQLVGDHLDLSLIHISEPTRQAEISYAVFCLK